MLLTWSWLVQWREWLKLLLAKWEKPVFLLVLPNCYLAWNLLKISRVSKLTGSSSQALQYIFRLLIDVGKINLWGRKKRHFTVICPLDRWERVSGQWQVFLLYKFKAKPVSKGSTCSHATPWVKPFCVRRGLIPWWKVQMSHVHHFLKRSSMIDLYKNQTSSSIYL